MPSPSRTAKLFLALVICSTIFLDYWGYSREFHSNPGTFLDVIEGRAGAPLQYRIGVPWAEELLRRGGVPLPHGFALLDLVSAAAAVYMLYLLLERTPGFSEASEGMRWFCACAFAGLVEYYLPWVTWYQRPETLPSAAVVVATLWLLTVRLTRGRAFASMAASAGMLVLAAMQGFIRADVALSLHLGVLLVCCTSAGGGFALSRWAQAGTSAAAALLAGGIQWYLMEVKYPHAPYPPGPDGKTHVVQLVLNLTQFRLRLLPFALFMFPWGWTMAQLARRRSVVGAGWLALVAGSVVYLAMWITIGKIDEVRIFLPFAMALAPLTCVLLLRQLAVKAKDAAPGV